MGMGSNDVKYKYIYSPMAKKKFVFKHRYKYSLWILVDGFRKFRVQSLACGILSSYLTLGDFGKWYVELYGSKYFTSLVSCNCMQVSNTNVRTFIDFVYF